MAARRLLEDPPAASSMEEDSDSEAVNEGEEEVQNDAVENGHVESGEEEDDDGDDDEEEENANAKEPNVPKSESDSGSETESDAMTHSPTASDFTVKPIISRPMTDSPASKSDEDTKKGRLWGVDDEVAILEGMIEFKAKNGAVPSSNMVLFHEFLRSSLKADVSKSQLMDKVRRLKKKYYRPNEGEEGEVVFSKGHELKLFDLAKRIWGAEANGVVDGGTSSKKRKSAEAVENGTSPVLALPVSYVSAVESAEKKSEKMTKMNGVANGEVEADSDDDEADSDEEADSDGQFLSKYPFLRESLQVGMWDGLEGAIMQTMPLIGSSKAKGLNDRWRKLRLLRTEVVGKKVALVHEQSELILDSMRSEEEEEEEDEDEDEDEEEDEDEDEDEEGEEDEDEDEDEEEEEEGEGEGEGEEEEEEEEEEEKKE